jgi:hypothetical protein
MEKDCLSSGFLCNLAWLAPLPLEEWVTILYCNLMKMGIGPDINTERYEVFSHFDKVESDICT